LELPGAERISRIPKTKGTAESTRRLIFFRSGEMAALNWRVYRMYAEPDATHKIPNAYRNHFMVKTPLRYKIFCA
jgi:hypothetical protein